MTNVHFDSTDSESIRRERLYAGDIYVYSSVPAVLRLCELARAMCEEAFAPLYPPRAQYDMEVGSYAELLKKLKPAFIHHPACKEIIPDILGELGCDLAETYFDVPRLRTACAGDYLKTGIAYAFKPHRDTWYSPPMCQINWWMPVYPIAADNTMAFHPAYWDRGILNSSSRFNYQDWNQNGRVQAHSQSFQKDTRIQSEALETLTLNPDLRLTCPPGGIIVFSAAHLHSTVPNTTDSTRISIDFRTVDARDIHCQQGANNIDSAARGTTLMDYLRGTDLTHFADELIERYRTKIQTPLHPTPESLIDQHLASQEAHEQSS